MSGIDLHELSSPRRPGRPPRRPSRADRLGEVDRYYRNVLRCFVFRIISDHGRAEEIVQETLLRLWQRPGMLTQPAPSLGPWLFTVVRNLAYDELRCARRRREFATDSDTRLDRRVEDASGDLVDSWVVQQALATLSHQHREIIVHAYYRRATTSAIASELGIPPGTVKSRLHYALRALGKACLARGIGWGTRAAG